MDAEGDGYFVLFDTANSGLGAALDMQLDLARQTWPEDEEVRVRMGLHVGDVLETRVGLVGLAIHQRGPDRGRGTRRQVLALRCGRVTASNGCPTAVGVAVDRRARRSATWARSNLFQLVHPALPRRVPAAARHRAPAPQPAGTAHVDDRPRRRRRTAVAAAAADHRS